MFLAMLLALTPAVETFGPAGPVVNAEEKDAKDVSKKSLPDYNELYRLCYGMDYALGGIEYDARDSYGNGGQKLIGSFLDWWTISGYVPGELDRYYGWEGEGKDPRGYCDSDQSFGGYYSISLDSVRWAVVNIFHMPEIYYDSMINDCLPKEVKPDEGSQWVYIQDGYLYSYIGGIGWEVDDIEFEKIKKDDKYYYIRFIMKSEMGGEEELRDYYFDVKLGYEKVDGESHWTVYSIRTESRVDVEYNKEKQQNAINTIHGIKFNGGGLETDKFIDVRWGWNLFNRDASNYSHDLGIAGLVLSQVATRGENELKDLLGKMGFENIKPVFFGSQFQISRPATMFASKKIRLNGKDRILVAVVVRGTTDVKDLMTDIFDSIDGFKYSAENVYAELKKYIQGLKKTYGKKTKTSDLMYFVTGHSLGGAVSNHLGDFICTKQKAAKKDVFVYTFAAPQTVPSGQTKDYPNIHNIINIRDGIPTIVGHMSMYNDRYGHGWFYDDEQFGDAKEKMYGGGVGNFIASQRSFYHHWTTTYLAMMIDSIPSNMGKVKNHYSFSMIHCPVDVTVKDENGKVMAYTKDDKLYIEDDTTPLLLFNVGDKKYIYAEASVKYTIEFSGTDDGTMEFTQKIVDPMSNEVYKEKAYKNVKIEKGKRFSAEIKGEEELDRLELSITDSDGTVLGQVDETGKETLEKEVSDEDGAADETSEEETSDGKDAEGKSKDDAGKTKDPEGKKTPGWTWPTLIILIAVEVIALILVFIFLILPRIRKKKQK